MRIKRLLSCILALVMILSCVPVNAAQVGDQSITAAAACVMDYDSGEVLYEYNGYARRVPASMTKIMNMYCVYDALKNGEITLDTVVPISQNVYEKSRNSIYQSVLPLNYDTTYTVDEMIGVVVSYSASGAAVALAELVGGTEEAFVERMNKKAQELGIDAYYYDSCGIAENQISPISMANLARDIIMEYPDIINRSSKKSVYFHGNTYKTTDHLLDTYYYEGADGLKTGTTAAAGYCFCGTAVRGGHRLISVVMSSSTTGQRFVDTARLLDYGFSVIEKRYSNIYFTNMRTFIDGNEVPTFCYNAKIPHIMIIAEDLVNYGFDMSYDATTKTVYMKRNPDKSPSPMQIDEYRGRNGEVAWTIAPGSVVNVILNDGASDHALKDVYNVGGYTCMSVDEFGTFFEFEWDGENEAALINTLSAGMAQQVENNTPADLIDELTSASAFIMDYDTENELYSFDADTQKPVASIAKMMSVYVLLDAVKGGELSLDDIVPISENVYNLSRVEDYKMMVNLEYDETYTLDEMIDMIVIDSAAACVTACAELLCGSEAEFVKRMNEKAKEIGIDSIFYNGTGVCLNPETDKENLMSAREVAKMTRCMINDYPEILEHTKCASVDFHKKTYYNLNKLFTDYYYEGADGFKNGMTNAAGYCMCGTAQLEGKRVITVTLPSNSNEARFTDTIKMFDYGFRKLGIDTSKAQNKTQDEAISQDAKITVNIDGNYVVPFVNQSPVIIDGRAMLPIREIMETLGKKVDWNGSTRTVTISDESVSLDVVIGEKVIKKTTTNLLDGSIKTEEIISDAAPVIINGYTCIPIRAVAESFGMAVIWEGDTSTILIIAGVC